MSDLSPLEAQFPRLALELAAFWGSPTCFNQLQDLLMDARGGRQGFPADVYSDLSLLLARTAPGLAPRHLGRGAVAGLAQDARRCRAYPIRPSPSPRSARLAGSGTWAVRRRAVAVPNPIACPSL